MINFVTPMPGLGCRDFALHPEEGTVGAYTLASTDHPGVKLVALDPHHWAPGYEPAIPQRDLEAVGAGDGREVVVLVVATIADQSLSLNLRAPVLINPENGRAVQSILTEHPEGVREPALV